MVLRFILIAAVFAAPTLQAEIYRWVDENGQTVFSQTPPPDRQAQRVKPPPPPAESPETAQKRLNEQLQKVDDYLEDREAAKQEREKLKAERERKAANCQIARGNYAKLETATNRVIKMPNGEYKRLDDNERLSKMREAQANIDKYCK